jgi:hypothetical protein
MASLKMARRDKTIFPTAVKKWAKIGGKKKSKNVVINGK